MPDRSFLADLPPRRRICFVTADLVGPIRNGGIGTAVANLADVVAAAGHDVTVLFTTPGVCEERDLAHWIGSYAEHGIHLVPLPVARPHAAVANPELAVAHDVFRWLLDRHFDIVHFHEWRGHGFVALQAKRAGIAFADTLLCVTAHGPSIWHRAHNAELAHSIDRIETDFMERRSVALADQLFSPSRYLLDWMRAEGWAMPAAAEMRGNVLPAGTQPALGVAPSPAKEVVFFGRLEVLKGIELFCEAVEKADLTGAVPITFLGKASVIHGRPALAWLADRIRHWPVAPKVLDTLGRDAALAYLAEPGRLAVTASIVENSPYAVAECIDRGIPLLAADVGGVSELICPADHRATLFAREPAELARRLRTAVSSGIRPARPASDAAALRAAWCDWHNVATAPARSAAAPAPLPLITVCVTHRERPKLLCRAVESLLAQDYPNLELLIVDDGSVSREALAALEQLEGDPRIVVIRRERGFPGAARNSGAARARGSHLLFFDDDNIADPDLVSTLHRAAAMTGAPIVTCAHRVFDDGAEPGPDSPVWIPLGAAVGVGLFRNAFGDTVALIEREAYRSLGGFTEDRGTGHEDWELFAKAALAGLAIEVVPRPLYAYRRGATGLTGATDLASNFRRSLRPYQAALPPQLAPALELVAGLGLMQIRPNVTLWRRYAVLALRSRFQGSALMLRLIERVAVLYRLLRR